MAGRCPRKLLSELHWPSSCSYPAADSSADSGSSSSSHKVGALRRVRVLQRWRSEVPGNYLTLRKGMVLVVTGTPEADWWR
jgi:hypothetical protein